MSDVKQPTFIEINESGINYAFHFYNKKEESGMVSFYIPAFDMYFSSSSLDNGKKIAGAMTQSFFHHWIKNEGFRSFVLQIHKLGFKASANHELTIKQLLSRQRSSAKFKAKESILPEGFLGSESQLQESKLEMAM